MRIKRLRSACQSIAHHAVSGLSYIHPHALAACRAQRVSSLEINLLNSEPCPPEFRSDKALLFALRSLKKKFEEILVSEEIDNDEIVSASLTVYPDPAIEDDYCSTCIAAITPRGNKQIRYAVNYLGNSVHLEK